MNIHFLSKNIIFAHFAHSQPFNEMFIFSGKSHCCIAAGKEYLTRRQTIS